MTKLERLKGISLFSSFRDEESMLKEIEEIVQEKKYPAHCYIINEGEVGTNMFILSKGNVRVEKKTLLGDSFPVVNLSADMNVFFGEMALLDNDQRSASVFTLTETECYLIDKHDFDDFCFNKPYIGYQIIRQIATSLAGKLRKTTHDSLILIQALCCDNI